MNTGEVDPTKLSEEGRKELLQYLRFREVYIYLRKSLVFLPLILPGFFFAFILTCNTGELFMGG